MTSMRVTDLDDFSLSHIWRPYWPTWLAMNGQEWDGRSHLDTAPMGMDETAAALKASSQWSDPVIARLRRINVTFPSWVVHPLVDVILERVAGEPRR